MRNIFGINFRNNNINKRLDLRYFHYLENIINNNIEPSKYFIYFNDFVVYPTGNWTITVDSGNDSRKIADEINGVLTITNDDSQADALTNMQLPEMFAIDNNKPIYFETKMKVSEDTDTAWFVGLACTDTDVIDGPDDCACFKSDDGDANINFKIIKGRGDTTDEDTGKDISNDTWTTLSFIWDGIDTMHYYIDREKRGKATLGIPDTVNLALTLAIQNGNASDHSLSIDYIKIMQKR